MKIGMGLVCVYFVRYDWQQRRRQNENGIANHEFKNINYSLLTSTNYCTCTAWNSTFYMHYYDI